MTSQSQINEMKRRAAHLRSVAAKAFRQGLNAHAKTLEDRAAELERRAREYENLKK